MRGQGALGALALAVMVVGCGGGGPHQVTGIPGGAGGRPGVLSSSSVIAPWRSGSRLRAHLIDGGDGAAHFVEWRDTMLDVPCVFSTTPAGVFCLPPQGSVWATQYFTDAACTQATWVTDEPGVTEGSYAEIPANACDPTAMPPRRTLGVVGALREATGLWVQSGVGDSLQCSPAYENGAFHQVQILATPPYVAGAVTVRAASAAGLHAVSIDGQDGSQENFGFFDPDRQGACALSAGRSGADGLCLPVNVGFGEGRYFSDPTCKQEKMLVGEPCPGSTYGVEFPRRYQCAVGSLPRAARIMQLDPTLLAPVVGSYMSSPTTGVCGPYRGLPLSGASFQSVLSDYPLSAFPAATPVRLGTGRLAAQLHAADDGTAVHESPSPFEDAPSSYRFWDTTLNVECAPRQTADGILRCLPSSACSSGAEFIDSACAVGGAAVDVDPTCDPAQYEVDPCEDDSAPATAISVLGPPQTTFYQYDSSGCVPGDASSAGHAIAATTPVPFETFAPLTDHIE